MKMKPLLAAALLAFGLTGCAEFNNAWSVVTGATISPTAMIVAVNSFDAIEATATNYIVLCTPVVNRSKLCNVAALKQIVPAVRSGRIARNNLEAYVTGHPGALGPAGLYDALTTATTTLGAIEQQYGVGV